MREFGGTLISVFQNFLCLMDELKSAGEKMRTKYIQTELTFVNGEGKGWEVVDSSHCGRVKVNDRKRRRLPSSDFSHFHSNKGWNQIPYMYSTS